MVCYWWWCRKDKGTGELIDYSHGIYYIIKWARSYYSSYYQPKPRTDNNDDDRGYLSLTLDLLGW